MYDQYVGNKGTFAGDVSLVVTDDFMMSDGRCRPTVVPLFHKTIYLTKSFCEDELLVYLKRN